jgi:hypothetical protein
LKQSAVRCEKRENGKQKCPNHCAPDSHQHKS